MTLDDFLEELGSYRKQGDYYMARCPAHDDSTASLQVSEREDGSIGVFCQAGCDTEAVLHAVGRQWSDLFPEQETIVYPYRDEQGNFLFEVVKEYENGKKKFRQRRYDDAGTEIRNLDGVRRVLYRLPDLLAAPPNRWVYVCEGEKDVEAFWEHGYVATCNPHGANQWKDEYSDVLTGRHVRIVQDRDESGRQHSAQVMLSLKGKAATIELLEARHGKDPYDHFAAGYGVDDFVHPSVFQPMDFRKPVAPPEWILDGLIAAGDLVLAAGVPKLGKSWFTQALAVTVANGNSWFIDRHTAEGNVLYFDEENPLDVVYQRLVGKLGHQNFPALRYIHGGGLRLDTHPEKLMQEAILFNPRLIFIDSLARVHGKDENSFAEMSEILNGVLKPLARETGAAVVLIHHHDKAGHGPRGSSDIEAAVDCILNMKGVPGTGAFTLTQKGRRGRSEGGIDVRLVDAPMGGVRLEVVTHQ